MKQNIQLSNQDKLNLFDSLYAMLSAGIPILEVVESMLRESKGNSRTILQAIKEDLMQGKQLHQSMQRFPKTFDTVTVNLLKAAEESGTLEETLKLIQENIKKDIDFNDKVKAALAYPVVVVVVFSFVLSIILVYVVPKISGVLARLSLNLPLPTRILIGVSNFIITYPIFIIGTIAVIAITIYLSYKFERRYFLNLLYKLPLLSTLQTYIDLTRFTRSMALMLKSGIPLPQALELSSDVVNKQDLHALIIKAKNKLSSGQTLSEGFKNNPQIPVLFIRITEAGEKSGSLDKSMSELADHFDREVSNRLKAFTTLLEPLLIVIIGLTVGGIMITIIGPIYQLIGSIRPQ